MNVFRNLTLGITLGSALTLATASHAVVINETNDFTNTFNNAPIATLDVGANTVTGGVRGNIPQDVIDVVTLTVAEDSLITGIDLTVSNYSGTGTVFNTVFLQPTPAGAEVGESTISIDDNGTVSHELANFPLAAGIYDFQIRLAGVVFGTDADWQMDVTVAPVPIPGAMLLFGSAIFGLQLVRKAKRSPRQ